MLSLHCIASCLLGSQHINCQGDCQFWDLWTNMKIFYFADLFWDIFHIQAGIILGFFNQKLPSTLFTVLCHNISSTCFNWARKQNDGCSFKFPGCTTGHPVLISGLQFCNVFFFRCQDNVNGLLEWDCEPKVLHPRTHQLKMPNFCISDVPIIHNQHYLYV